MYTNEIKGEITPIQQQLIFFIKKNIFLRVNLKSYLKVDRGYSFIYFGLSLKWKKKLLDREASFKKMSDCLSSPDAVYKTLACR